MNMPVETESARRRNRVVRFLPWLVVVAILLVAGFIRVRLLEVPLERDEGEYAYVGQLILQGIPPYELAYNMKLPGTYYAYAAGMAVFGQTVAGVHLTLLAVNSLTCVFVFLLGRKLAGVTAGLAACASYAIMSVSPAVMGLAAHATQFVALFAVPGAWLLWNALATGGRRTFFLAGLLFGLAFMMKQPGLCFGLFAVVMVTWQAFQNRAILSRDILRVLLNLGAGMSLPFAGFCLWTFAAGNFGRFWFWTFDYARSYAGQISLAEGWASLSNQIVNQLLPYGGFWLLAAAGLLAARRVRTKQKEQAFALVFLGCSLLGTTPGLHFREHYFVLALPAFALVLGLGVEFLRTPFSSWWKPWMPLVLLALALAHSLGQQRRFFFQLTPTQFSQSIYRGNPVSESRLIAQYVRDHSPPETRMAVVGSEPQLYFYAHRHSATGYIYTYPLMEAQPYASFMQREMIKEIESGQPEFIVVVSYAYSWLKQPTSELTILREMERYTRQCYVPVAAVGGRAKEPAALARSHSTNAFPEFPPEAMILYQRKPASALAAQFLGDALSAEGKFSEAGEAYTNALQLCPGDAAIQAASAANDQRAQIQTRLAALLAELRAQPTAEGHAEAAALYEWQQNFSAALEHYSAAQQLQPANPQWLNNLAWLLATCPRQKFRDSSRAVTLARQACELTGFGKAIYMGTLAAAYAEAGKFDEAIATAQKACDRAAKDGDASLLQKNQELLKRYRAHQTARE